MSRKQGVDMGEGGLTRLSDSAERKPTLLVEDVFSGGRRDSFPLAVVINLHQTRCGSLQRWVHSSRT